MDKKKKKSKKWIIVVSIIAVIVLWNIFFGKKPTDEISTSMIKSTVKRDTLLAGVSSEGTLEPYERYEITALVSGDIIYAPFNEGDQVKKNDILYKIDSISPEANVAMSNNNLQSAIISRDTAKENVDNLTVKATKTGYLTGFNLEVGDNVMQGAVLGTITSTDTLTVTVTFSQSQMSNIYLNKNVKVTLADYMSIVDGTITYISNSSRILNGGTTVYDVEVTLKNPGAVKNGTMASVSVETPNGTEVSMTDGAIKNDSKVLVAKSSGEVISVGVKNEQKVQDGQVVAVLKNDDYQKAYNQATLNVNSMTQSLRSAQSVLDNYAVKSPIYGTVITKNKKLGDKAGESMANTKPLMVVADMSKMKFNMDIDELDITKIQIGQEVRITAEAVPNENFVGKITKISAEGDTMNGVTTYTVEAEIENYGSLRTGMNVDANIIVNEIENVLMIPISATTSIENVTYAYVLDDKAPASDDVVYNDEVPSGFRLQRIEIGENNNDYVEVKSGLNEGDEVYSKITESSDFMRKMMTEMMGATGR